MRGPCEKRSLRSVACRASLEPLDDALLLLDLWYELIMIELLELFALLNCFIEAREGLELGQDRAVQLIDTLECFLSYSLLMICEEQPAEVFVEEEIPGMIGRFRHAQLFKVLSDWVDLWVDILKDKAVILLGHLAVNIPVGQILHEPFGW